jgi:hypothetical protein
VSSPSTTRSISSSSLATSLLEPSGRSKKVIVGKFAVHGSEGYIGWMSSDLFSSKRCGNQTLYWSWIHELHHTSDSCSNLDVSTHSTETKTSTIRFVNSTNSQYSKSCSKSSQYCEQLLRKLTKPSKPSRLLHLFRYSHIWR